MKFAASVLLEIVDIVRQGLVNGIDVSARLREIDVEPDPQDPQKLTLTPGYIVGREIEAKG